MRGITKRAVIVSGDKLANTEYGLALFEQEELPPRRRRTRWIPMTPTWAAPPCESFKKRWDGPPRRLWRARFMTPGVSVAASFISFAVFMILAALLVTPLPWSRGGKILL